jgi:uncharacterized protein (UPF0333 family)
MRRFWFYLLAIILVVAAAAAIIFATKHSKNHSDNTANQTAVKAAHTTTPSKNACTIFSLADAKQLLGDTAKGGVNPIYNSSTDFDISTCTYTQDQGANVPIASKKSATLLVQAPKTDIGAASNQKEFGPFKPAGVQDLTGYGDQAYWDAEHGQINILKNNIWYIISYGPTTPSARTLDQAKQLADLLANKL